MPYLLSQTDPTEQERLALLQEYYDPRTIAKLLQLGVAPGWRCFDVGAGAGSIVRWLAEHVVPKGSVVAIDLDTTLLEPLASATVSVHRLDVRREALPKNANLVHSRLLLEHLPEAKSVLKRMIQALRPGGWVLLTDTDFRTVHFSEPDAALERLAAAFAGATVEAGWDMRLGPNLASLLEGGGLMNVAAESWQTYDHGGTGATLLARTYRRLRDPLIKHGAKGSDVDRVVTRIERGDVGLFSPTSWMAWGRRPRS